MIFWFILFCWVLITAVTVIGVYNISKLKIDFFDKSTYLIPVIVLYLGISFCFYKFIL